jgi:hypothetical protein
MGQWNRNKSSQPSQPSVEKATKKMQQGFYRLFKKTRYVHETGILYTKIYSRWTKNGHIRIESMKFLEEKLSLRENYL